MLINRETDYAIRILRSLSKGQLMSMNELVEAELVPKQFAYKITKKLQKAGFITIVRGVHGGCMLDKPIEDISVLDVIHSIDDQSDLSDCMNPDFDCQYKKLHGGCTVHCKLHVVQNQLDDLIGQYSIADLLV